MRKRKRNLNVMIINIEIARPLGLDKVKESLNWAEFKKRLMVDGYKVIDKESGRC